MLIKQSSATKVVPFFMVDSADHITGKTGLTPTVTISKNGAAFASPAGVVTETGSGWYKIAANATDSNTIGSLLVHATATGADPFDVMHEVTEATLAKGADITGFNDIAAGTAMTLTSAYDAAKTASSQSTQDTLATYVDTEVAAIKAKTDQLVFTVANRVDATATMTISAGDLTSIADAILKRDFSAVSGEAARSLLNAARFLRNKFSISGTTLTVTREDDATPAWVSVLSTDAAAVPIVGSDPT